MRLLQWVQGRAGLRDEQVSGWTDCASFGYLGGGGTHRNREGAVKSTKARVIVSIRLRIIVYAELYLVENTGLNTAVRTA